METFGKAAWIFLLAGSIILPLIGCAEKPDGKFATYDHLKKPAAPVSLESEKQKDPSPLLTATPPAETKTASVAAKSVAKKTEEPKVAKQDSTAAPQLPAATPASPSPATRVTNAAFQASIASTGARPGAVPASTTAPRKIQLLVPDRKFRTEGPEGACRVSYDDIDLLKVLNMDPVPADAATKMPSWLKGLEGKRIRIRGFMYPTFSQTGIHAFGLARDNQICCFGRNPKIYDVFDVQLRKGVTTDYLPNRPFDVVGVFHIRPEADEGKLFRLYEMDDATVLAK